MLEAVNLYRTFTSDGVDYEVLKNVNLKINQGECVAIIGKSGSGKSTLMHLLACLDTPTLGRIMFEEQDVSILSEKERNLLRNEKFGFVFQQFFLNGRETVLENVLFPLRIRGMSQYKMIRAGMDALEAVDLKAKEDKKAKDLSGGEKQRVCIARALVGIPKVIFADEPTGNLDSNTGELIEKMLFDLNREKGITLIIVTHDSDLAKKCNRIIELKDGEIIKDKIKKGKKFEEAQKVDELTKTDSGQTSETSITS
ncbi:MAG: ABC transporter ATP-binding protein [Pyrinomonadaceae bacterium]|nr:ABC transporter ATP-binding protein [Pyrinomonadaceae bacterium]